MPKRKAGCLRERLDASCSAGQTCDAAMSRLLHAGATLVPHGLVLTTRGTHSFTAPFPAAGCAMDGVFVQPVAVIRDDTDAMKTNRIRVVVAEGRNREVSVS